MMGIFLEDFSATNQSSFMHKPSILLMGDAMG
jgi:hypothetical protein